ncbi:MAG: hypothetical protein IJO99_02045 [Ruminococcus sp.]|nr:hypothetical protein [Ruminococcus sp.]
MLYMGMTEDTEKGWIFIEYRTTWEMNYDFILDASQVVINTDLRENLQQIAVSKAQGVDFENVLEEARDYKFNLRECPSTKEENGALIIAGRGQLMECPIQLIFFNNTSTVKLCSPERGYFEENGVNVFDNYLNSVEIKAHCLKTERDIKANL